MAAPPDDPDRTAERPAGSSPDDPAERFPFLSPPDPAHPGDLGRLGSYRVVSLLGEGGMGFVFRGEDDALGRPVALKVMRPEEAAGKNARERFLREGRAAAAVKSDHVVTIYQVGEENGVPFLAMEFLDGQTLADWLKDWREANPVPARPEVILAVARDLLRGLVAAHAKGLIHRDIKPPNLWIESGTNRLKLLDFGLVRDGPTRDLTLSGAILGTAAYMAPEQARGKAVDARTDLFGVGVVLHEMLAGQSPFRRETYNETIIAVVMDLAPPAASFGELPPGLAALIDRLLEKSPDARPATATEVLAEVTRIEQAFRGKGTTPAGGVAMPVPSPAKPKRPPARPVSAPRQEALVVCARGTGTHRTIGEAIRAASPDAEIRIRPGVYREGVVLDRHVALVGDGPVEQIVIESAAADCLFMKTDRAAVTGLTLRCTAGAAGKKFYAVDIPRGELLLTGCAVTSDSLSCIAIHGNEANPTVRDCRIHDGKQSGVYVFDQGRGTVEGCDISANAHAGVRIQKGGNPTVRDCQITANGYEAVWVSDGGRGTIEGCRLSGNQRGAWNNEDGCEVVRRRNTE